MAARVLPSAIEEMREVLTLPAKSGASFDMKNDQGLTALHIATSSEYTRCIELPLQNGASINETGSFYGNRVALSESESAFKFPF